MKIREHSLILKCIVGSHSYGTNVEGSDIDYKGVYIQTPQSVLIDGYIPQIEVGKDETYYELGRFISLCEKANPTVLELLYTPEDCIVYKHDVFDKIVQDRQKFLTKKCRLSFGGYAVEQIRKARGLDKKMNWEKERIERKDILDFCYMFDGKGGSIPVKEVLEEYEVSQEEVGLSRIPHMRDCYAMYVDVNKGKKDFIPSGIASDLLKSNDVTLTSIPKGMTTPCLLYFNKDGYSTHCKEYNDYEKWLKNRNVQRYVDIENHGQQIDGKNMLHCVRLIQTALEIPEKKVINVRRPNNDFLIGIRKGKYDLESLLANCELDILDMDKKFEESDLPDSVDKDFIKQLVIKVRQEFNE